LILDLALKFGGSQPAFFNSYADGNCQKQRKAERADSGHFSPQ
jgi:hypothetical protein